MLGRRRSLPDATLLLIDESLSPSVARALSAVGFNARSVEEALGQGAQDPDIIEWVGQQGGVWVHADNSARRQHRQETLTARISTLLVRRPKEGMSAVDQLRAIIYVLEDYLAALQTSRGPVHRQVSLHGQQGRQRVRLE